MDEEVHPGEGHEEGGHQGRDAPGFGVANHEDGSSLEAHQGVSRGEGFRGFRLDEVGEDLPHVIGAGAGDEGLETLVADEQAQQHSHPHHGAGLPGLGEDQQDQRGSDPEDALVAEAGDEGHDKVHEAAAQVLGDPVQDREVKGKENVHGRDSFSQLLTMS